MMCDQNEKDDKPIIKKVIAIVFKILGRYRIVLKKLKREK